MQSESQLRHRARTEGLSLTKFRERSRWYGQYGLVDPRSNTLVAWGMQLDDVERELATA